ncbi:hypothetical protein LCGC14_0676910 [marine sediment metagenome]|uniref:LexA repressor DNA-binding domain-containing protein n=1 Tax=marine sediment metagenome TaxID=412755 RepID=A0A0F9QPE4_9ZZZZ
MKVLSPRRRAILAEIRKNGRSPSLKELARQTGLASWHTVYYHLVELRNHGYLTWANGLARTLTLTGKGLLAAQGYELIFTCDQDGIHEVG